MQKSFNALFSVCPRCRQLTSKSPSSKCRYCHNLYQAERAIAHLPKEERELRLANRKVHVSEYNCEICDDQIRGTSSENIGERIVCTYCFAVYARLKRLPKDVFLDTIKTIAANREGEKWKPFEELPPIVMVTRPVKGSHGLVMEKAEYDHRTKTFVDGYNPTMEDYD